ncbi:hypothetical protein IMCC3135_09130 [Granulosicoccus antarcticus IMCC3135]|uniref:TRAP transporter small permease protein n=2 Tax=Granulosicoccus TaxID=437504 RepID=A0A2Z2NL95_9GAMM|nr:hypothetical protein IMCC3135_09130 [Granulosicoccus antarcticus IMCC3135]
MITAMDRVSRCLSMLSGIALGCVALLIVLEIILRNFFDISLHFLWEIGVFVHMGAVFLGLAWTLRTGGHIRVTWLKAVFPRGAEWLALLIGFAISAYVSFALIKLAWSYFLSGRTSGSITDTPLMYPAAVIAFGASFMSLQILLRALSLARGLPEEIDPAA